MIGGASDITVYENKMQEFMKKKSSGSKFSQGWTCLTYATIKFNGE